MRRILSGNLVLIFLLTLICVPVVVPYFREGFFPTHDGEWAVVRLADMFRTVRDFQIPPRFSGALNFGYGYPLFNFAYPFPYYLGLLLYVPLQSFVLSVKSLFVASVFLSAISMYFASNYLWKNKLSAFISAVFYIYLPYRMVDLYVRGSIGESLSFILFPLIFYFSLRLFASAFSRITVVGLSLLIAILVMTHNIMTIIFIPVLVGFIGIRMLSEKRLDVLQSFLLCLGLGAGISFSFWFPALYEKSNILLSVTPIADRDIYFVKLQQLVIPSWGYGPPTEVDGFSYQLGIAHIIIIVVSIFSLLTAFVRNKFIQTPVKWHAVTLLLIYGVCFSLLFSFMGIFWKTIPLLSEINYPWTLLSQMGFISSLIAGYIATQGKILKWGVIALGVLAIILTFPYAKPISYSNVSDLQYLTNEATTTSSSELMPLWVKEFPKERFKEKVEVVEGSAVVSDVLYNSKSISFKYDSENDSVFKINTIYYPGWNAYLNGEKVDINYDNPQGVMYVKGSRYRDTVQLFFRETTVRSIANVISLLAVIVVLFILLRPILIFKS